MATGCEQLAAWVREFRVKRPSEEAIEQAKLVLLDTLGCSLAALTDPIVRQTLQVVAEVGGSEQARIWGTAKRSSIPHAVFANGVLTRILDLNDFFGSIKIAGHPSDNIAVALTVGDWRRSSGPEVLSSIVMAYELYGRLQDRIDHVLPWDHVTASGLVAPAIAGTLMDLDQDRMAHAFALSAVHCPTLAVVRWGQLSSAKGIANAAVAQTAVFQTFLAAKGMTGPLHAMEGPHGLATAVFSKTAASELLAPTDGKYRIMQAQIKAYPCIGTAQALVAVSLQMRSQVEKVLDEIEAIDVTMADLPSIALQLADSQRRHPASRETADHSFYFLAAIALLDGELTPRQFEGARWDDPKVKALMDRITIRTEKELGERAPGSLPVRIRVGVRNGRQYVIEVLYPPGHPKNRFGIEGIVEKFARYTGPGFRQIDWGALVAEVERLDRAPTVEGLLRVVCTPDREQARTHLPGVNPI